jgi:hypothetical protein
MRSSALYIIPGRNERNEDSYVIHDSGGILHSSTYKGLTKGYGPIVNKFIEDGEGLRLFYSTRTNRKTIIVPEHHPLFNLGTLKQDGFEVIKNYIEDYTIDLMLRLYVDRLIEKLNNKV